MILSYNKNILGLNWVKSWEGNFSVLSAWIGVLGYGDYMKRLVDEKIPHVLIIRKNNITTCYLVPKEIDNLGLRTAAKVARDKNFIKQLTEGLKKSGQKLKKLLKTTKNIFNPKDFDKIIENVGIFSAHLNLNKELVNYLPKNLQQKYFSRMEKARKKTEKIFCDLVCFTNELIKRIAKIQKIDKELVGNLSLSELKEYLNFNRFPNRSELNIRKSSTGFIREENRDYILNNKEIKTIESSFCRNKFRHTIKGTPACSGKTKGKVKIILDFNKDFGLFKKGMILVTGMTNPNFVSLIKNASAIVTDAGGILCHAAIIARELKKPCIIGTKIATQILKDGDLVEVNANRGIVKILKKVKSNHKTSTP